MAEWVLSIVDPRNDGVYLDMRVDTEQLSTLDEDEFKGFWHNALDQLLLGVADHQPSG